MEEIKVGEYVRTKKGTIDKAIIDYKGKCNNENCKEKHISCKYNYYCEDEIAKHSPNLIDLIEEDDYVNGDRMDIVEKDENGHTYYMQNCELPSVNLKDIKSIVTHEQFAQIEYKVEE